MTENIKIDLLGKLQLSKTRIYVTVHFINISYSPFSCQSSYKKMLILIKANVRLEMISSYSLQMPQQQQLPDEFQRTMSLTRFSFRPLDAANSANY